MNETKCGNCKYFNKAEYEINGLCHRFPPPANSSWFLTTKENRPSDMMSMATITHGEHWCGEFVVKADGVHQ